MTILPFRMQGKSHERERRPAVVARIRDSGGTSSRIGDRRLHSTARRKTRVGIRRLKWRTAGTACDEDGD